MLDPTSYDLQACKDNRIPAKPEILIQLHDFMESDDFNLIDIAELISHDVGLSAAVLKMANSAAFGMGGQIADIRQACVLFGVNKLMHLVSGYVLKNAMPKNNCLSLERFWDSASDVAEASAWVSRLCEISVPVEEVYAIGLFHDCGIPVMASCFDDYSETLQQANNNYDETMTVIEDSAYKVNHAIVGYKLTSSWGLPEMISQVILQHHADDVWKPANDIMLRHAIASLKLSENIADRLRRGEDNVDWEKSRVAVFELFGLNEQTHRLLEDAIIEKMRDRSV